MSTHNFDAANDFTNGFNTKKLRIELLKEFPTDNPRVRISGDTVSIAFDSSLTSEEITQLNSVISTHDGTHDNTRNNFFILHPTSSIIPISNSTTSAVNNWTTIVTFEYGGKILLGDLTRVQCLSKISNGASSTYDIRLINHDNFEQLAETTGHNNTDYVNIDLGTISNTPIDATMLEIQIKIVGIPTYVSTSQIIIYHESS